MEASFGNGGILPVSSSFCDLDHHTDGVLHPRMVIPSLLATPLTFNNSGGTLMQH